MFSFGKKKKDKKKSDSKSVEQEVVEKKAAEERANMKDSVIIHTMPKRFLKVAATSSSGGSSKGVGILILVFGLVLLVGIGVFSYFVFFKKKSEPVANLIDYSEESAAESQEMPGGPEMKKEPVVPVPEPKPIKKEEPIIREPVIATTTLVIATSLEEVVIKIEKPEPKVLVDADKDGLSMSEEKLLGTKDSLADSDSDGYSDLSELFNLFNPAGDGSIMVNPGVEKYTNSQFSYSIYYMKPWELKSVSAGESVIFKIEDTQFIQIIAQKNLKKQSINDWYIEQFEVPVVKNSQIIYKKGWSGIGSETSNVTYLIHPSSDYIFTFMANIESEYEAVAEMMLNSFEIVN